MLLEYVVIAGFALERIEDGVALATTAAERGGADTAPVLMDSTEWRCGKI